MPTRPTDDSIPTRSDDAYEFRDVVPVHGPVAWWLGRTAVGRVVVDRLLRTRLASRLGLVRRRRVSDPFRTLEVQRALARLDAELTRLRAPNDRTFAPSHHLNATIAAYEMALDDACRLAGIARPAGRGQARRLRTELELRNLGWWW